jgi:hypothetical protein
MSVESWPEGPVGDTPPESTGAGASTDVGLSSIALALVSSGDASSSDHSPGKAALARRRSMIVANATEAK